MMQRWLLSFVVYLSILGSVGFWVAYAQARHGSGKAMFQWSWSNRDRITLQKIFLRIDRKNVNCWLARFEPPSTEAANRFDDSDQGWHPMIDIGG